MLAPIYASRRRVIEETSSLIGKECKGIVVPTETAIDIDSKSQSLSDLYSIRIRIWVLYYNRSFISLMDFIAELCQNHNGDPSLLMKMCDEAANAGATYIKMQTIYAANLAFPASI